MAVYFFYGEEDYNIEIELNKLRSKLNPDFLSMSYKNLDNPKFDDLINALRVTPMMFGSSLTVIDIERYFSSDDIKFDDKELAEIESSLENVQDNVDIVFVVKIPRDSGKKLDSRRKLYKILSKFNVQEFPQFSPFKQAELSAWIKSKAKEKKLKINDDAITVLIEQIGTNLRQFDGELEKLKLVAYPENNVTKQMVIDNCISNQDLFNITSYIMHGEKGKALLEFRKLTVTKFPLEILSAMQTMIRQWVIIKAKASSSVQEVMKLTGIRNEYRIQNLKKDLKNISVKDLVNLKNNLYEAEYKIKSGLALDIESEVELALIR